MDTATYAVVDITKKKKKKTYVPPEESVMESTSETSAVYAVVDKKEKTKCVPQSNIDVGSDYSMIALTNMYPQAEEELQNSKDINNEKAFKSKRVTNVKNLSEENVKFACLLVIVIVIAVIMSVCFTAAFIEIFTEKSASDPSLQVSAENISAILSAISQLEGVQDSLNITLTNAVKQQENHSDMLYAKFENSLNDTVDEITEKLVSQEEYVEMLYMNTTEYIEKLYMNTTELIITAVTALFGVSSVYPAPSCATVLLLVPSSPSGYYWIRSSNGSAVSVYCNMIRSCGGVTGGWMRVAELDMTNSSSQCPHGLRLNNSNIRTCVGTNTSPSCSAVIFPTVGQYSMVCGKIMAYQVGAPNAFAVTTGQHTNPSIDTYYVDGVSLTHGSPRQHIWTFAAAPDEVNTSKESNCPCFSNSQTTTPPATSPPHYVGEDYFCDTGSQGHVNSVFYSEDPLWDGAGCEGNNMCCSFNNPPWFYKQLPQPTTDNIEMRVCRDENTGNEDIAIENIELYVK